MAYVIVDPEMMATAASNLSTIGSDLSAAHLAAAARTTSVIPAAADDISTAFANMMSTHGLDFQKVAQSASTFHQEFTQNINASAASYSSAEAASAATVEPRLISLEEFFQLSFTELTTSASNFAGSFRSFPNLEWAELTNAVNAAVAIALFPITYPVFAITVFAVEAVFAAIFNGGSS